MLSHAGALGSVRGRAVAQPRRASIGGDARPRITPEGGRDVADDDDIRNLTERLRALQRRVTALEQKLGDPIVLESGGNSIKITPRGIEIISAGSVTIL